MPATAISAKTTSGPGRGPSLPLPRKSISPLPVSNDFGPPSVIRSVRPRKSTIVASVMMNGWIFRTATPMPLTTPTAAPRAIAATAISGTGTPALTRSAVTTAVSARMDPTDRSMPPVRMTKVIPIAITPTIDAWRETFRTLRTWKNSGATIAVTTRRAARMSSGRPWTPSPLTIGFSRMAAVAARLGDDTGTSDCMTHDQLLRCCRPIDVGRDVSLVHDQDPIAHLEHLRQLGGDEDHSHSPRAQRADDFVDLALGPDVHAARGLVEDQHIDVGLEPFGEDDLLLVAARERPDRRRHVRQPDPQLLDVLLRQAALVARAHAPAALGPQPDDRDVRGARKPEEEALGLAVLGDEADAAVDRRAGRRGRDLAAVDGDAAGVDRVGPEDRARQLRSARSAQPGHAEHLAAVQLEVDVRQHAVALQTFDGQHDLVLRAGGGLGHVRQFAAHHHRDEPVVVGLGDQPGARAPAVLEDDVVVGEVEPLVEPVRDEDHRDAAIAQRLDHRQQRIDVAAAEHGGRLVEDQHAHLAMQRLGDLEHLARGDAELADLAVDVEVDAELGQQAA